jgi:protein gp37
LSIEPLLEDIECETLFSQETPGTGAEYKKYCWVIIGAETGNRINKVNPRREWIESIIEECRTYDIPVFMKSNLAGAWREPLIKEYPWGVSK